MYCFVPPQRILLKDKIARTSLSFLPIFWKKIKIWLGELYLLSKLHCNPQKDIFEDPQIIFHIQLWRIASCAKMRPAAMFSPPICTLLTIDLPTPPGRRPRKIICEANEFSWPPAGGWAFNFWHLFRFSMCYPKGAHSLGHGWGTAPRKYATGCLKKK